MRRSWRRASDGGRPPRGRGAFLDLLCMLTVLFVFLAPTAQAHGLLAVNVVVPPEDQCPQDRARCLETIDAQPILRVGDHVDLVVWNDDDEAHRILVTDEAGADPTHANTSAEEALASSGTLEPNSSREAEAFTIPDGAEVVYIWCDVPGHEAEGAWMRMPVEPAEGATVEVPGPGPAVGVALLALVALAVRRRPGDA